MLPKLYHTHHSLHPEDLPFWLSLARRAGGPVLELGCGTGRVLLPLAAVGFQAVGLDREHSWLVFLRHQLPSEQDPALSGTVPPRVFVAPAVFVSDMAAFHLAQRFALILLPCNTLSTLSPEARRAMLACVRRHLRPGGLFAFSIPHPRLLRSLPRRGESEIEEEFHLLKTGEGVQVSSAWERTRQVFHLSWHYDLLHPDGGVERYTMETHHSLAPIAEYERDLEAAGLHLIEAYGDYDGSPAGEQDEYWIGVARNE